MIVSPVKGLGDHGERAGLLRRGLVLAMVMAFAVMIVPACAADRKDRPLATAQRDTHALVAGNGHPSRRHRCAHEQGKAKQDQQQQGSMAQAVHGGATLR